LTDRVGALNINRDMQALGLRHTRVVLDDLSTSPGDMLAFFEMLARGQGVAPDASAEMVHLLARQRVNDRIPRLLPASAVVAHKTGNLPGVVNDAGIVYAGDVAFVIAVLVDGTASEGEAAYTIADLAKLSYEYFSAAPAAAPEVQLPTPAPSAPPRPKSPELTVRPGPSTTMAATPAVTTTALDAAATPSIHPTETAAP